MPLKQHTDSTTRSRSSRACDQCKKVKGRCDRPELPNDPCSGCLLSGVDCTYFAPTHKRGPPKGYLSALERRLHEAEALLGIIISSSDCRATALVSDLSKDSLAKSIIARVTDSDFGSVGRTALSPAKTPGQKLSLCSTHHTFSTDNCNNQLANSSVPLIDEKGHLVFNAPTKTWQDYLNLQLSVKSRSRIQDSAMAELHPGSVHLSFQFNPSALLNTQQSLIDVPPEFDGSIPSMLELSDVTSVNINSSDGGVSSQALSPRRGLFPSSSCEENDDTLSLASDSTRSTMVGGPGGSLKGETDSSYAYLTKLLGLYPSSPEFLVPTTQTLPMDVIQSPYVTGSHAHEPLGIHDLVSLAV